MKLDHIARIIVDQALDTIVATSIDGRNKLDYFHGSPQDVAAYVALANESLPGPFVLEAYLEDKAKVRGVKSVTTQPFRWIMPGLQSVKEQPMAQQRANVDHLAIKIPDVESIRDASRAETRAALAEYQVGVLREQLEQLQADLEDVEDVEDVEDDEPMAAPAPAWYHDGQQTIAVAERIMGLLRPILVKPAPVAPAAPVPMAEQGLTNDERELLEAMRAFRAADPDMAATVTDQLLTNYGKPQPTQPNSDGNPR